MAFYGNHLVVMGDSGLPLDQARMILTRNFAETLLKLNKESLLSFKLFEFACDLTNKVTREGRSACASGDVDHWHLGWKAEIV